MAAVGRVYRRYLSQTQTRHSYLSHALRVATWGELCKCKYLHGEGMEFYSDRCRDFVKRQTIRLIVQKDIYIINTILKLLVLRVFLG